MKGRKTVGLLNIKDIEKDMSFGVYDSGDAVEMNDVSFSLGRSFFFKHMSCKINIEQAQLTEIVKRVIGNVTGHVEGHSNIATWNDDVYVTISFEGQVNRYSLGKIDREASSNAPILKQSSFGRSRPGSDSLSEYGFRVKSVDDAEGHRVMVDLIEELRPYQTNSIVWAFSTSNGTYRKQIFLKEQKPLTKDLYPWIKDDTVQEYFKRYLDSSDSILLLTGVPGTGKTTFIRNMISENKLNAEITYDEKLISGDEFYLHFINDEDTDILIIEDADNLIHDREKSDNVLLNKLLNISDGLVKNVAKKIVFSTNITDLSAIDPALIRPGRCFDVLDFRKLRPDEAAAVVKNHGLSIELKEDREYTLAELFSSNSRLQTYRGKFGF